MDERDPLMDDQGCPIPWDDILAIGNYAVVVKVGDRAVKMAVAHQNEAFPVINARRRHIRREQGIYCHLQPTPDHSNHLEGVVPCLGISGWTIELPYMSHGTLLDFLKNNGVPSITLQKKWVRQLAVGLRNIHAQGVIHRDIALRNILLDRDGNAKFTDFGSASKVPAGQDIEIYVDDQYGSMWTDLYDFGSIVYNISTGTYQSIRYLQVRMLDPDGEELPSLDGLWAKNIIEECWTGDESACTGAEWIIRSLDRMASDQMDDTN